MVTQTGFKYSQIPYVLIPGMRHTVELYQAKFVEKGKTPAQYFWENTQNQILSPVLTLPLVRRLWESLKDGHKINPGLFYDPGFRERYGAEPGDLLEILYQLRQEMNDSRLAVNGALVVLNNRGLVSSLDNAELPAIIQPLNVSARTVMPKDEEHGMTFEEFRDAGCKIEACGVISLNHYPVLKTICTGLPQGIEPLGLFKGDVNFTDLDPRYGEQLVEWLYNPIGRQEEIEKSIQRAHRRPDEEIRALSLTLGMPDERWVILHSDGGLGDCYSTMGVLRGRELKTKVYSRPRK